MTVFRPQHFPYTLPVDTSTSSLGGLSDAVSQTSDASVPGHIDRLVDFVLGLTDVQVHEHSPTNDNNNNNNNNNSESNSNIDAQIALDFKRRIAAAAKAALNGSFYVFKWASNSNDASIFASQLKSQTDANENLAALKRFVVHPRRPLLAALRRDDSVAVRNIESGAAVGRLLANKWMHGAKCLEWMPLSASTLAVGTASGICVWRIFTELPADAVHYPHASHTLPDASVMASSTYLIRPTSNEPIVPQTPPPRINHPPLSSKQTQQLMGQSFLAHHIRHPLLSHVSALAFSYDARFLYAGSLTNPGIAVIDLALMEVVEFVKGFAGRGTKSLSVSPDGRYLVQVCSSKFLRIWWTQTMTSIDLECTTSFRDACWMPDSKTLLLAVDGDVNVGRISALQVSGAGDAISYIIHPHFSDLPTNIQVNEKGQKTSIGGVIKQMVLDKTGTRLAVTFENPNVPIDNFSLGRDIVCIFDVQLAPHVVLTEIGQLNGPQQWDSHLAEDGLAEKPPRYPRSRHPDLDNQVASSVAGPRPMWIDFVPFGSGKGRGKAVLGVSWENGDLGFETV